MPRSSDATAKDGDPPAAAHAPARGVCCGFAVHSSLEFEYLRAGGGAPLEVIEAATLPPPSAAARRYVWEAVPGKRNRTELHAESAAWSVRIADRFGYRLEVDPPPPARGGMRVRMASASSAPHRELLLWTTPVAIASALYGSLPLHAAAVEIDGRAVLLAGESGAGKTTAAAALFGRGHRLLSEDLACCSTAGEPHILPGPAVIRLHPAAAERLRLEDVKAVHRDRKIHLSIDARRRGGGHAVPIRALVLLQPSPTTPLLQHIPTHAAVQRIWPLAFRLPGTGAQEATFRNIAALAAAAPVLELSREQSWQTFGTVLDLIESLCR